MVIRSTFGDVMFAHAPLPDAVQALLLDVAAEFRDAAAGNPYGLAPRVWRACYTRGCPAGRARGLLAQPTVRPDDVAWALAEVGERRAGPLETLLFRWYLDADQQVLLARSSVPDTLAATLALQQDLLPQTRLAFAGRLDARIRLSLLRAAPDGSLDDATIIAVTADVETWPPGTWSSGKPVTLAQMLGDAVDTLAPLGHNRQGVVQAWANSGVATLAAAAAASPLSVPAQRQVTTTCVAALNDPDRRKVATLGLLTLADRFDVDAQVRADAVEALLAADLRGDLVAAGVSGRRAVLPSATLASQLTAADVELLLLRGGLSGPLRTQRELALSELVDVTALDEELAERLLASMGAFRVRDWRWLDTLLGRFPHLTGAADELRRTAERAAGTRDRATHAWQAAVTPGAKRKKQPVTPDPGPVDDRYATWTITNLNGINVDDARRLARWAATALGDNPDVWRIAIATANGFAGTLGDLITVAHATAA